MSKLYIANAKAQNHDFVYRVPDQGPRDPHRTSSGARRQVIPYGGQVALSGDLTTGQIDAIIDQHFKYGLTKVEDITRQQAHYVPLICSIDKPVSETILRSVMEKNREIQIARGRDMRKAAAVATANGIEANMAGGDVPGELKGMEFEVVEERNSRSDGDEMTAQRLRITKAANPDGSPKPRAARGGRRKAA